jgi:hypothetical protein
MVTFLDISPRVGAKRKRRDTGLVISQLTTPGQTVDPARSWGKSISTIGV